MLKKLIRLNWDDLAVYSGILGGVFLLIQLIVGGVMVIQKPDESILISELILMLVSGFLVLVAALSHVMIHFPWAVQYGRTRKNALGLTMGLLGAETLFILALTALLSWAERTLFPHLWAKLTGFSHFEVVAGGSNGSGLPSTLLVNSFELEWWWLPLVLLGAAALGIIGGAVIQRFGSRGGWTVWTLFMVGMLFGQSIPWEFHTTIDWLIPTLVVLVVLGLVWSIWSLLHAVIKV